MSKQRLFERFKDWYWRDRNDRYLEVLFAGCTVRLIGEETIKMRKDNLVEYYIISVGTHHIVFDVKGKLPPLIRNEYVNRRLRRWRSKGYVYTRWYDI